MFGAAGILSSRTISSPNIVERGAFREPLPPGQGAPFPQPADGDVRPGEGREAFR